MTTLASLILCLLSILHASAMITVSGNVGREPSWTKETDKNIRESSISRKCVISVDPVQFELQNDNSCFVLKSEIGQEERGSLCVKVVNGGSAIQFTFETTGAWTMVRISIWGDTTPSNYPIKYGAPNYEEFPILAQTGIASTKHTETRPLNDFVHVDRDLHGNETIVAEIIAAVHIENLFDSKSPRNSEQAWAHQNWLSMVNNGGVSHFFSRLELQLPNVLSICSSPTEDALSAPSSPLPSMPPSVSPSMVVSSTTSSASPSIASSIAHSEESSRETSPYSESITPSYSPVDAPNLDRNPQLSLQGSIHPGRHDISSQDVHETDKKGQEADPSKVIVGIAFTLAYGNGGHTGMMGSFRSAFEAAFTEFASDVVSRKESISREAEKEQRDVENTPSVRQRRFLRGQHIKRYDRHLLVELDQQSTQIDHYSSPGKCPTESLSDEKEVICQDGVAHYTLLLSNYENVDEVCRNHLETTKALLEEGRLEKLIQGRVLNKDITSLARVEQARADFCRSAGSEITSSHGEQDRPQQEHHQYSKNASNAASGVWKNILTAAVASLMLLNCIMAGLSCFHSRRCVSSKKKHDLIKRIESGLNPH